MKRFLTIALFSCVAFFIIFYAIVYYATYSEGIRSGELIKISTKGVLFKTWEGELSQGISGAQIFQFSVTDRAVIEDLQRLQGDYVKLTYVERYMSFFWLGDSHYFVTKVEPENSPHYNNSKQ
ncbi:6-phosphogluconate dehydrogenase [Flavobacterium sp. '19STA2R22 D10 B1']|uniref:6-phosphogluconate dehydrogenase n=1 Tax=Flavobacterium aerium TaxID=3037261 RepID=UPI00278BFD6E|nr:6-phosphogluconate dehydrogenase [Flavobacterium sp. '19STA2R22 D10 B1']